MRPIVPFNHILVDMLCSKRTRIKCNDDSKTYSVTTYSAMIDKVISHPSDTTWSDAIGIKTEGQKKEETYPLNGTPSNGCPFREWMFF